MNPGTNTIIYGGTCDDEPFDLTRLTVGAAISAGDYFVEFVVDKLIPALAIILFYAKGGSGKSTIATMIAAAVRTGTQFMGLATLQRPVVIIDFENPMAVLKKRINAIAGAETVYFWPGTDSPPQLNKAAWIELRALINTLKNPLIIIDTLSSSCSGLDILSNNDYSPIMDKLVSLRNLGATLILLHHTPKNDATNYIGASCIYNQCDHVLAMYPVKTPGQEKEVDEDEAKIYRFGTKDKTRFDHHAIYVEFDDDNCCFKLADDPDQEIIDKLKRLIIEQRGINQTGILSQTASYATKAKTKRLLKQNEGRLWGVEPGENNAKIYRAIEGNSGYSVFCPLGSENRKTENRLFDTPEKPAGNDTAKTRVNTGLAGYSVPFGKPEKPENIEDAVYREYDLTDEDLL